MARDDERANLNTLAVMFSVAITLLGLLIAVASTACDFRSEQTQCFAVARPALAALPLLPLATMAYIQIASSLATLRSYYLRGLEREIRSVAGVPISALAGISSSSYTDFTQTLVSLRRGRKGLRISGLIVLGSIIVVFGGFTFMIATKMTLPYQVAMALVYIPLVLILFVETLQATVGGRSLLTKVVRQYLAESTEAHFVYPLAGEAERGLASYLLFPRPEDWHKWLFLPFAFGFGLFYAQRPDADTVLQLALALLVLEYLVYQGRYQWNDIRGLAEDLVHPEKGARKRLPVTRTGPRRAVEASAWTIAGRQLLAITVIVWLFYSGRDAAGGMLAATMMTVWLAAVWYETLRAKAAATAPTRMSRNSLALVILVGCGYAARAIVGLVIAGVPLSRQPVVWVLVVAAWTFGVMFVSITWALEGLAHVTERNGRYYYATGQRAEQDGLPLLGRKPHLGAMLSFLRVDVRPDHLTKGDVSWCTHVRPFIAGGGPLLAPWNLGLIASTALGFLFTAVFDDLPWQIGLTGLAVTFAASIALVLVRMGATFRVIWILTLVALGATGVPAGLLWVTFSGMYALFRTSSYHSLKHPFDDVAAALGVLRFRLFTHFVGPRTTSLLGKRKLGTAGRRRVAMAEPGLMEHGSDG